jgi:DNA-binding MarR family transcriptional regulator
LSVLESSPKTGYSDRIKGTEHAIRIYRYFKSDSGTGRILVGCLYWLDFRDATSDAATLDTSKRNKGNSVMTHLHASETLAGQDDKERAWAHSAREQEFFRDMLGLLAAHVKGETTLNLLRVGHFISLCSEYHDCETSNVEISRQLNIPRSTVSRIVSDLVEAKMVIEQEDPDDGRRRLLRIAEQHPEKGNIERSLYELIGDYWR